MIKSLAIFLALAITVCCVSQKQGITGRVLWLEGNQMPGPGRQNDPPHGIAREIYIYEPTSVDQVKRVGRFFTDIQTKLVSKTTSNPDGSFTVNLPPGEYSVFTKEERGLFANILDGRGRIHIIEVNPKTFTEITFQVNYQAAF